jgi:hypothetical protein
MDSLPFGQEFVGRRKVAISAIGSLVTGLEARLNLPNPSTIP